MNSRQSFLPTLGQLLLVTLLGIPLITPLLQWSSVPCTHDGHLHVHRIAALRHAWENGIYFSRWVPDLAFGYGYPFFVYREPGPLYAILFPHLLGLPLPAASNLFYALSSLAAGWFMFLWVRDLAGSRAGMIAAVAYMAAPYLLLDTLVRGNAPESMALPLLPFLLWMGRRWLIKGTAVPFLLSVLGLALLALSHNISVLIFTPTLFIYLFAVGILNHLSWTTLLARLLLLIGLGLGISFFYTGGALLEMDQVTLSQSIVTRNNDFHFNFASLSEILAPVTADDPNLLNPPLPIRLGWAPFILALFGATTPLWNKWLNNEQRWHVILMAAAALIYLFMALAVSLPVWESLPLIDFVQFPWRFIGRAALPVAFLAGMPFMSTPDEEKNRDRRTILNIAALVAIVLLILEAMPALYPRYCDEEAFPSIVDVHQYEAATGLVGIDPEGSYFPRTVARRPDTSRLVSDYIQDQTPQRFDLTALPAGATANAKYDGLGATITISTPESFTARYLSFDFPGWEVTIDEGPALITPSSPEGLITFLVPAGAHNVRISWQSTPLRTTLALVSVLSLLGIIVVIFYLDTQNPDKEPYLSWISPDSAFWIGLFLVAIGLLLFKVHRVDNYKTPLHKPGSPAVDIPADLHAAEMQFAGHSLSAEQVASGDTFDVELAWATGAPTSNTYQSNVWLASEDGLIWSEKETQRPRLFEDGPATWEREPDQWAWDSREVRVLDGTPPGQYDLILTLFNRDTLQPLTLVDEMGAVIGPTAVIGQIEVTAPKKQPTIEPQHSVERTLDEFGLSLLGFNQDRSAAAPGDIVLQTFFWERIAGPLPQETTVQLLNEAGEIAHTWQVPLLIEDFDNESWEDGQRLRAQHLLRLPAGLDSGVYQFQLQDQIPLGEISITAPGRMFALPESAATVAVPFGQEVALKGYTISDAEASLVVDLVWQAVREMPTAYRVFVHLVDNQGSIVAQSDAEPVNWTRPTTGWAPGEFIIDRHTLAVPPDSNPGELRFLVGLYDPASGRRLMTDSGDVAELYLGQ